VKFSDTSQTNVITSRDAKAKISSVHAMAAAVHVGKNGTMTSCSRHPMQWLVPLLRDTTIHDGQLTAPLLTTKSQWP